MQNTLTVAKVAAVVALMLGPFLLPTGGSFSHLITPSATVHLSGLALFA